MANKLIKKYILEHRNTYSIDDIKSQLIKAGYTKEEIESSFGEIDYDYDLKNNRKDISKFLKFGLISCILIALVFTGFYFINNYDFQSEEKDIKVLEVIAFDTSDNKIGVTDKINITLDFNLQNLNVDDLIIKLDSNGESQIVNFIPENTATISTYSVKVLETDELIITFLNMINVGPKDEIKIDFLIQNETLETIELKAPSVMGDKVTILYD